MAQDQVLKTCGNDWVELSDGPVTSITFIVLDGEIFIRGMVTGVKPAIDLSGYRYTLGEGELQKELAALFHNPSITRVFFKSTGPYQSKVIVDNA